MSGKQDGSCDTDDTAARRKRADRIHRQIEDMKEGSTAAPPPPKSPRDYIADRMRSPTGGRKKSPRG